MRDKLVHDHFGVDIDLAATTQAPSESAARAPSKRRVDALFSLLRGTAGNERGESRVSHHLAEPNAPEARNSRSECLSEQREAEIWLSIWVRETGQPALTSGERRHRVFRLDEPSSDAASSPSAEPLRRMGSRHRRSRTRSSGGSPRTTRLSASRRGGGGVRSSRRASADDRARPGGVADLLPLPSGISLFRGPARRRGRSGPHR
jgi:hypothetical protein